MMRVSIGLENKFLGSSGTFDVGEGGRRSLYMAQRKDNPKLGSTEGIRGKPEPGLSPVPKMEPKGGKELHIHDLEDGSRWTIRDETIVELIKKHHAAPDQKTKDEILKILQSKVATSSRASGLESKISAELQKLKLKSDRKASVGKRTGTTRIPSEKNDGASKADKANKTKLI